MTMRTALAGATTTTLLVAALGNSGVVDAAREADSQALGLTVTGFANWDVGNAPGDVVAGVVLRLGVAIVVVALLCALAGTARARGAAFLGGWGALVVAAGAAGAIEYVYLVAVVFDGQTFGNTYVDGLVQAVNAGAAFGLWTGWLVGLAVALFTQPDRADRPVPAGAAPWATAPPQHRIAEPPPPWWAPTQAGSADAAVRPGPTAFPPGGVVPPAPAHAPAPVTSTPPVAPGAPPSPAAPTPAPAASTAPEASASSQPPAPSGPGATHEMTTASGDPHPSDPDGTEAVGLPQQDEAAEADATTTMPESTDRTIPMPRKPD